MNAVWDMFVSALRPLADAGQARRDPVPVPALVRASSRENVDYLRELAERFPLPDRGRVPRRRLDEGRASSRAHARPAAELGLTYVVVDEPQGFKTSVPPVVAATSPDLAMIRFHGHNAENWEKPGITAAERFRYLYTEDELSEWVGARAASWRASPSSSTS